jgi:hypothetical protein
MTDSEVTIMQCRNCRASCDGRSNFCGRCGQRLKLLKGSEASINADDALGFAPSLAAQPQRHHWWQKEIYLVIAVISCLLLLNGSFLLLLSTHAADLAQGERAARAASSPGGVAWFYDWRGQSDGFALHLFHLPALARGDTYMGWLLNPRRPDQMLATGPLTIGGDGSSTFLSEQSPSFNSKQQDLRLLFTRVIVTCEHDGASQRPGGQVILDGSVTQGVVKAVIPLFVTAAYTPGQVALLSGLRFQMNELVRWVANMMDARQQRDMASIHVDLLRILYIIEGADGIDVQQLHILSLPNIGNEGDGFGLLPLVAHCQPDQHTCGYLGALSLTLGTLFRERVTTSADMQVMQTVLTTMTQLTRELQQQVLQLVHLSTLNAAADQALGTLEVVSDTLLNGRDLDGDGSIDPVPGEAATAQFSALVQYVGSISLSPP